MKYWTFLLTLLCNYNIAKADLYPGMVKLVIGTHGFSPKTDSSFTILGVTGTIAKNSYNYISDTNTFKFFKNRKDKLPLKTLSFYFDWRSSPRVERIVEKSYRTWFNPMSINDDTTSSYFDIYLVCKSKHGKWLEVVVNEKTQETLWLKNKRFVIFFKWKKLYKKEDYVGVKQTTNLYERADSLSRKINSNYSDYFEILKIKGNWMKVRTCYLDGCYNESGDIKIGWINFKSNDNLFIELHIE